MQLVLIGLSHKTAPVEVRESLALTLADQKAILDRCLGDDRLNETVIVSTCNRSEFYFVTRLDCDAKQMFTDLVLDHLPNPRPDIADYLYFQQGEAVVSHLFRVAASLDSMVVGEAQILGQLKEAYDLAFEQGTTARVFNKLFRLSFETGKRVRNETNIGSSAVSISYAAVELAKRVFDSLEGRRVLLLGAGEMSELTALHMQTNGASEVVVANRTFARAEELAEKFKGSAIEFDQRYEALRTTDIVVSATAATEYVITKEELSDVVSRRRDPLFFFDIAVPRDIDPQCADFRNVYVYDVDALDGIVESNKAERMVEAAKAEVIIQEEITNFEKWLELMEVEPTIASMREQAEQLRQAELARAYKRLRDLSPSDRDTVDRLTQSIVNKMLHNPTVKLREASVGRRGIATVETARYLYGLEEEQDANKGFRLIRSLLGKRPSGASD
ncbi:MAG: glutamyl-tRNA reductase [Coriobacteriia bacterium]|nr:glutamyl-tRNA reductase [Coriobacteriia bacterium]MCL2746397.1 glutamyl-tRNA reductase [Coriobacteriia bacterium]MCL2870932.1 glutamyl-tRNA reductase [Coriobacteriia bacterium]